jgi:hypothetical protein
MSAPAPKNAVEDHKTEPPAAVGSRYFRGREIPASASEATLKSILVANHIVH